VVIESGKDRWKGNGSADCTEQGTARQPDFLAFVQVGSDSSKGERQIFNIAIANQLPQGIDNPLSLKNGRTAERQVEQLQNIEPIQRADPPGIGIQFPCGINTADQRSHG